MNEVKGTKMS